MAEPPPPPEFLFGEKLDPVTIHLDAQRIVKGLLGARPSLFEEIRAALSAEPLSFKDLLSVDGETAFVSPEDDEYDGGEEDEEDDYDGYPTASKYAWAVAEELLDEIASELREEDDSIDELTSDERRELIQMIYDPLMEEIEAL